MRADGLAALKRRVDLWRKNKVHRSETVPEELIRAVMDGVDRHGIAKIIKATGFQDNMIKRWSKSAIRFKTVPQVTTLPPDMPTYTRVSIVPPQSSSPTPMAEIATASGSCVRLYTLTPELGSLVLLLCDTRGHL